MEKNKPDYLENALEGNLLDKAFDPYSQLSKQLIDKISYDEPGGTPGPRKVTAKTKKHRRKRNKAAKRSIKNNR